MLPVNVDHFLFWPSQSSIYLSAIFPPPEKQLGLFPFIISIINPNPAHFSIQYGIDQITIPIPFLVLRPLHQEFAVPFPPAMVSGSVHRIPTQFFTSSRVSSMALRGGCVTMNPGRLGSFFFTHFELRLDQATMMAPAPPY